MTFDSRWKNPQGKDLEALWRWAQDLTAELRKGEFADAAFADNVGTGLTNAQLADMAAWTIKMRNAGTTGDPQDVTINGLTEETSLDGAADFLPLWDAGGAVMRKGLPTNLKRAGGLQLLNSGIVSAAATLDIVLTSFTGYQALKILLSSFVPATDDDELWMRFSTDGGSSFDATGYTYSGTGLADDTSARNIASSGANQILVAGHASATVSVSNVASEGGADTEITLHGRTDAGRFTRVNFSTGYMAAVAFGVSQHGQGLRETAQNTDAVRFLFETGNIASGNWALYGYA